MWLSLMQMNNEEIKEMLKLIPNNFPINLEDLKEIFKNNDA